MGQKFKYVNVTREDSAREIGRCLHLLELARLVSAAEVDYAIARGGHVVPVEVKAGKTGRLRSLRQFVAEKRVGLALRFNTDTPSLLDVADSLNDGTRIAYRLLSLPLYLLDHVNRLVDESAC